MNEESIFSEALQRPTPEAQAAFLEAACAGDAALRRSVEELLRAHERAGSFLAAKHAEPGATCEETVRERPGTVIGPYKLLEQIGEGGFGVVFMAEQTQPIRRKVALKILKPGMDTRQVVARFEAERQALALMDHPNIAHVFDGGETESGRPYFVMELVKGTPITKYCDEQRLTPRQRLELFVPVCQAIQHAHQKGIIHRDVKPSNILVAPYDGKPVVKVIDFGVAKATGQKLTERTLFTGFGAVVGTLEYMSPEQAELNNQDIDTRSDIYSLGVLLYELLTGTTPLTREQLRETPFPELLRLIREEEPPRPSTRLSSSATLPAIATARQTEPAKLTRLVRGELDWIVMKALEKDRGRRYQTANGLARDLEHYLADEPVEACPPSAGYRLRKFARKHKKALITAAAFLVLLVAGIAGLALGLVEVQRAKDRTDVALGKESKARQRAKQALDKMSKARQRAQQALDEMSTEVIQNWLSKQPKLEPAQKEFLKKALAWYEELTRETGDSLEAREAAAKAYYHIASIHYTLGQAPDAERAYRKAITAYADLAAADPKAGQYRRGLAQAHHYLGHVQERIGQLQNAEASYREALAAHKALAAQFPDVPANRRDVATTAESLANLLEPQRRTREAEEAYQDALAIYKKLATDYPTQAVAREDLARCHSNLGALLEHAGRAKEAEAAHDEALTLQKQLVADFPDVAECRRELAETQNNRGVLLDRTGRTKEAEAAFRDSLDLYKRLAADFPAVPTYRWQLARTSHNLGCLLSHTGLPKEEESAIRDALALYQQLLSDFPTVPTYREECSGAYHTLGNLLSRTSRGMEAETAYHQALSLQEKLATDFPAVPGYRVQLALTQINIGRLLSARQRPAESLPWHQQALALLEPIHHKAPQDVQARNVLCRGHWSRAEALENLNRRREALTDWDRAFELSPPGNRLDAQLRRALCRARAGKATEAVADAAALTKDPGTSGPTLYDAACIYSLVTGERGPQTLPSMLQDQYAGQAVALLRRAQAAGFFKDPRQVEHLKKDPDLAPLRARADYRKFVAELEAAAAKK
jgi:serine/threonine protein kinase